MTRKEHATETRKRYLNTRFEWINAEEKDGFENLGEEERILMKLTLRNQEEEL
jgi:hypothetical protein